MRTPLTIFVLATSMAFGQKADPPLVKPVLVDVADIVKVENVARAEIDKAGKYRVLVVLDADEAREFKFQKPPTGSDIAALRERALAAKAAPPPPPEKCPCLSFSLEPTLEKDKTK